MQTLYIYCLLWSALVLMATTVMPIPRVPNGFQCPTCQNLTSDSCTAKMQDCYGEEKICLFSNGSVLNKDNTANSSFVTKGCITELILSALMGEKNVHPGVKYRINNLTIEAPSPVPATEPSKVNTTEPSKVTKVVTTTPDSSPHISSFLALWLPTMSWVLLMTLLS